LDSFRDAIVAVIMIAVLFVLPLVIQFGPRFFTRAFWRPDPTAVEPSLRMLVRAPIVAAFALLRFALVLGIGLGVLYAIVWVLRAMWRAT
jgi:hypothetical protein